MDYHRTVATMKEEKKISGASVVNSMEVSLFVPLCCYKNSSAVLSLRTMCSVEEFGRRFGTLVSAAYSLDYASSALGKRELLRL